jgi:hypothetical protein
VARAATASAATPLGEVLDLVYDSTKSSIEVETSQGTHEVGKIDRIEGPTQNKEEKPPKRKRRRRQVINYRG